MTIHAPFEPPLFIPDELTDEERVQFSADVQRATIVHVRAVQEVLRTLGLTFDQVELTRFAAQTYLEGFRARAALHALQRFQAVGVLNQTH